MARAPPFPLQHGELSIRPPPPTGSLSVPEMANWLKDDELLCGVMRLAFGVGRFRRVKWAFLTWSGPSAGAVKRAKAMSSRSAMKAKLGAHRRRLPARCNGSRAKLPARCARTRHSWPSPLLLLLSLPAVPHLQAR